MREFAESTSGRFNLPPDVLLQYWSLFSYDFGEDERKGLMTYYGYAAEIGAIETVTDLRFWSRT